MTQVSRADVTFGPAITRAVDALDGLDVTFEHISVLLPGRELSDLTKGIRVCALDVPADRLASAVEALALAGGTVSSDSPRAVTMAVCDEDGLHMEFELYVAARRDMGLLAMIAASAALDLVDGVSAKADDVVARFGAVPVALYRAGRRGEAFGLVAQAALQSDERSMAGMAPRVDDRSDLLARLVLDESGLDASTPVLVRSHQAGRALRDVLVNRPELVDVALALDAPGQDPLFEVREVSIPVRPRPVSLSRAV